MPKWSKELSELYREVTPREFYRSIFQEGELDRKDEFTKGKYVGIACEFTKDTWKDEKGKIRKKVKRYTITDELDKIDELLKSDNFVAIAPLSYFGKHRYDSNVTKMYAFAIEIDNLRVNEDGKSVGLNDLIHQFTVAKFLPCPNYIVASGNGVHLYYLFEEPLICFENVKRSLRNFKKDITPRFWNKFVTDSYKQEDIQFESPFQVFRMAGGVTKKGDRTQVFEVSSHPITAEYLNLFVVDPVNMINTSYKNNIPLAKAKEMYPEWYEKRVINKQPKGSWTCKRDLYDWWKRKITYGASVSHRYFCLKMLSIYAIKCNISEEELESDLYSFLEPFESLTTEEDNHFTEDDVMSAMQVFYEKGYVNYTIDKIIEKTAISIEKNKRNYQKQCDHLEEARAIRDIRMKRQGKKWTDGNGRKPKKEIVEEWKINNPNGKKIDCERETGLSRHTVLKWWG